MLGNKTLPRHIRCIKIYVLDKMKKVASNTKRTNLKVFPMKQTNVRFIGEDPGNKPTYQMESESVIKSQEEYIENLQQQIYVLENETQYLQTHIQESNKQHPSLVAEGEKLVKKLAEQQKEIQELKIELKRKQTSVDLYRSERDRILRHKEDLEENFRKDKNSLLEELISTKKERDSYLDRGLELEQMLGEEKQTVTTLQEDFENIAIELDHLKREMEKDKEIITQLMGTKDKLQKDLFKTKCILESKPSEAKEEAINNLKLKISELHEQLEGAMRTADHEHLLRERLSQDNNQLIKRHAEFEAELAESRALLREEQSLRASLEQIHLSTVLDASEAKSRDLSLSEEIDRVNNLLSLEKDHAFQLTVQYADEQRLRIREEQKSENLQQRFNQREEKVKAREKENTELLRDKTFLKDQVLLLKQQLQDRDREVVSLKEKVQDMQVSVEEFIQNSQAATRVAGERWKQLNQLAQGIQALTSARESEQ